MPRGVATRQPGTGRFATEGANRIYATMPLDGEERGRQLAGAALPLRAATTSSRRAVERGLLIVILLVAFGLFTFGLDARGLWWDESLSLMRAQGDIGTILSNRIAFPGAVTTDQHPPLYFLILHIVRGLSGESDFVLRFPSVCFATLTVVLLYALGKRLRSARTGLFAAALGALSPFYIWYAQELRMYTLVACLGLAGVYCLWRAFDGQGEAKWAVGFVLAMCAGALTQYLFAFVIGFELILATLLWSKHRKRAREGSVSPARHSQLRIILWLPLLVLPALAYLAWRLAPSLGSNRSYVPLDTMTRDALNSFSLGLSVEFQRIWMLDLVFLALYVGGCVVASRRIKPHSRDAATGGLATGLQRNPVALTFTLVGYIFVPILGIWLASLYVPLYMGSRYLLMSSPAYYLGIAIALDVLAKRAWPLATLAGVVLLASLGYSIWRYTFDEAYAAKEDYRSAAEYVARLECAGDVIAVSGVESQPVVAHYYRGDLPVVGLPAVGASSEEIIAQLEAWGNDYDRLWLIEGNHQISDEDERVKSWLEEHCLLLDRKIYPGYIHHVTVSRYMLRQPTNPRQSVDPQSPLGAWGHALALLDYRLGYFDTDGATHVLSAEELGTTLSSAVGAEAFPASVSGKTLSVEFVSLPLQALPDLRASLRLVSSQGMVVAQRDETLLDYYPTSQWPVGTAVQHETFVRIPVGLWPGTYTLQLVIYQADDAEPLAYASSSAAASGEQTTLDLGRITVAPWIVAGSPHVFLSGDVTFMPLPTSFGGTLELLGYDDIPSKLMPDSPFEIELYWRVRQDIGQDYVATINWVDEKGHVWHSTVMPLGTSDYPTSQWEQGSVVRDVLQVAVPADAPAGRQRLHLLVSAPDGTPYLDVQRGPLFWGGRDVGLNRFTIEYPQ